MLYSKNRAQFVRILKNLNPNNIVDGRDKLSQKWSFRIEPPG